MMAMIVVSFNLQILAQEANAATLYVNSSASGSFATSTTIQDVTLSYQTSQALNTGTYATSSVITVRLKDNTNTVMSTTHLAPCSVGPTTQVFGTSVTFSTSSTATGTALFTFNAATTSASVATATLCVRIPSIATGIYSISLTGGTGAYADSGIGLLYVGPNAAGAANTVSITAVVEPILSVRLTANTCSLGALSIGAVNSCTYGLVFTTNVIGASAITSKIYANTGFVSGGNTLLAIGNNTAVVAGTEGYGIDFSTSSATTTLVGVFAGANEDPIPTGVGSALPFQTISNPVQNATTTVIHKAAISANTAIGNYSQVVNYITTASF